MRQYSVGLPALISIDDDGNVYVSIDIAEVSTDIRNDADSVGSSTPNPTDEQRITDAATFEAFGDERRFALRFAGGTRC